MHVLPTPALLYAAAPVPCVLALTDWFAVEIKVNAVCYQLRTTLTRQGPHLMACTGPQNF